MPGNENNQTWGQKRPCPRVDAWEKKNLMGETKTIWEQNKTSLIVSSQDYFLHTASNFFCNKTNKVFNFHVKMVCCYGNYSFRWYAFTLCFIIDGQQNSTRSMQGISKYMWSQLISMVKTLFAADLCQLRVSFEKQTSPQKSSNSGHQLCPTGSGAIIVILPLIVH